MTMKNVTQNISLLWLWSVRVFSLEISVLFTCMRAEYTELASLDCVLLFALLMGLRGCYRKWEAVAVSGCSRPPSPSLPRKEQIRQTRPLAGRVADLGFLFFVWVLRRGWGGVESLERARRQFGNPGRSRDRCGSLSTKSSLCLVRVVPRTSGPGLESRRPVWKAQPYLLWPSNITTSEKGRLSTHWTF